MKNNYEIKYHFAKKEHNNSFAESDIFGILADTAEIVSIESYTVDGKSKTKAVSCKPLRDFCDSYNDHLILYTSAVLISEYPEEPAPDEIDSILDRQEKFLLKNNFISINDYVGYESRRAYIYRNDLGNKLIGRLANQ